MFLVYLATICSAVAFLTGILAVGEGSHFHFSMKDILRGRRNAWLYIWVTGSSIFSIAHFASLMTFGMTFNWAYQYPDTARWMAIHAVIAFLITSAHLYIKRSLAQGDIPSAPTYLWGNPHVG